MDPISGGLPLARLSTAIVGSNGEPDAIALGFPVACEMRRAQGTAASSLHPVEPRPPPPISRKRALHRHLVAGCLDSKSPWYQGLRSTPVGCTASIDHRLHRVSGSTEDASYRLNMPPPQQHSVGSSRQRLRIPERMSYSVSHSLRKSQIRLDQGHA
jgi:hypothetical protein